MNFYEILEIDSRASTPEIERAYRKMARKVHPDLNAGDRGRSEARMKLLNEIRELLTDPLLRAGYDERLRLQDEQDARQDAQRARAAPRPQPPPRAKAKPADPNAPPQDGREPRRGPMLLAFGGALAAGLLFISFRTRTTPPAPELPAEPAARSEPAPAFTATAPATNAATRPEALAPPLPPSGLDVPMPRMRPGASPRGLGGATMFGGPRGPFRGRGVVHIGSTADDVVRVLGSPDRVETGRAAGDAVLHYGALRLEMKNGRVAGGDAAAR
jgi:hypothetical protein